MARLSPALLILIASLAWADVGSIVTLPGGSNGSVEYNKRGQFAGDSSLVYSSSTHVLSVPSVSVSALIANGQSYSFPAVQTGGYFLKTDGSGALTWATPSTFSSSTGTALGVLDGSVQVSSPTSAISFNATQFIVALQGTTTAYVSVDPSSVTVMGPLSAASPLTLTGSTFGLSSSSVTLQSNTFNVANKLIQADGSARFPALDGSQITNITASNVSTIDISANTNLVVTAPIILTGDTLSLSKTISQTETFASSVTVTAPGGIYLTYGLETATATAAQIYASTYSINSGYLTDSMSLLSTLHTLGVTYDDFYNHAQLNSSLGFGLGGYYHITASSGTTFDNGASGGSIRLGTDGAYLAYGNSASLGNSYFRAASGGPTIGGYLSISSFTAAAFNTSATSVTVTGSGGFALVAGSSITSQSGSGNGMYFNNPTFGSGRWRFNYFDLGVGLTYAELQPGQLVFSNLFAGGGSGSWLIKTSNEHGNLTFSDSNGGARFFSFDPNGSGSPTFKIKADGTTDTYGITTSSITLTSYIQKASKTKAQIAATTPSVVGQEYYCSDCTTLRTCISTGTAQGAFSSPVSATTACN